MNDVAVARDRLESAERELLRCRSGTPWNWRRRRHGSARHRRRPMRCTGLRWPRRHGRGLAMPTSWRSGPRRLGMTCRPSPGIVLRGDGSSEPYVQMVFARDVLTGRAAEARVKAARLREFASPTGLQSEDLRRVVDEWAELPDAVLEPAPA